MQITRLLQELFKRILMPKKYAPTGFPEVDPDKLYKELKIDIRANELGINEQPNTVNHIKSSIIFRNEIEKLTGKNFSDDGVKEDASNIAITIKETQALNNSSEKNISKENVDLRGQVAWLQNKLNAKDGRDYPPCWAEETTGKPQYLFLIKIHKNGLEFTPSWPHERDTDASKLPGLNSFFMDSIIPLSTFKGSV